MRGLFLSFGSIILVGRSVGPITLVSTFYVRTGFLQVIYSILNASVILKRDKNLLAGKETCLTGTRTVSREMRLVLRETRLVSRETRWEVVTCIWAVLYTYINHNFDFQDWLVCKFFWQFQYTVKETGYENAWKLSIRGCGVLITWSSQD